MPKSEELSWMNVVVRAGLNACTHPLEYSKVLIQIGHEPLAPYKSRTIFGREKLFYPSIFSYIAHIKSRDGLVGCYRGLGPKLAANVVSGVTFQQVTDAIHIEGDDRDSEDMTMEEKNVRFVKRTGRETVGRCAAIIASQPLHVLTVRAMAEFVGGDGHYTQFLSSITVIYKEEGIMGFFAGLVPRLVCDIGALWVCNSLVHLVNNYVVEDRDLKTYVTASLKFLASALWYPMQVVASCMAVSGSGLPAGNPPLMPVYHSWTECYSNLKAIGCLKRGSTLLWRTYTGTSMLTLAGVPAVADQFVFARPPKFQ